MALAVEERLGRLEGGVRSLGDRLSMLYGRVEELSKRVDDLHRRINDLRHTLTVYSAVMWAMLAAMLAKLLVG